MHTTTSDALFEYVSLPIGVLWGLILWQAIPTLSTLVGAALTLLSGIYVLYGAQKR